MNTKIVVNLQVEGMHFWKDAPEDVGFLSFEHRHVFHICCKKKVSHLDRDIEIIKLKREIVGYINSKYYLIRTDCNFFGGLSCEMLASEILTHFDLDYCSVLEDNENGAEVTKPRNFKKSGNMVLQESIENGFANLHTMLADEAISPKHMN